MGETFHHVMESETTQGEMTQGERVSGQNDLLPLLQFSFNCFETLQMFSEWSEDVHVGYNALFFLTFSALWTVSFFT